MRLLLVGAFPHPHHQGSQIYFQEQAIALRDAGADVTLVTYGSPKRLGDERTTGRTAREEARARAGFDHRTSPRWTSPGSLRSGPSWSKPLADLGLAMTLRDAIASSGGHDAFDAILTHHAEAAVSALVGLGRARPPVVYCVHTLLGRELPAYLRGRKNSGNTGFSNFLAGSGNEWGGMSRGLGRLGKRIDRWIAARVDGWIALTHTSERVMRAAGGAAPGARIPPPCPDPERGFEPLDPAGAARRHSLEPGTFFLYSGNLDAYQELDLLEAAAREMDPSGTSNRPGSRHPRDHDHPRGDRLRPRLVVATHQPLDAARSKEGGIEFVRVESAHEMQSLLAAARGSLVMRRAEGGFPIKIVNSLAVGTPVLAFREGEWGLEDERNALICSPDRPAPTLARAIERLAKDDALAKRLSAGARRLYLERHQPGPVARQTLDHLETVLSARRSGR